jgi:repressor LexA
MGLGEIIRRRREDLSLTQDQVAAEGKISKPYLSNIETGKAKNPPSDRVLHRLESALHFQKGELTRLAHYARTPLDVREEHEMLKAEVQELRGVLNELLAHVAGKEIGKVDVGALANRINTQDNVSRISPGAAVPIINKVTGGYPPHFPDPSYPPGIPDEYVRCPGLHDPQGFAVRVVGDSMEPEYREGDIVVLSPNTPARSGDDCFVRFDTEGKTTFKRYYQDNERTIRLQPLNSKYPGETYPREGVTGIWPAVFRIERIRQS